MNKNPNNNKVTKNENINENDKKLNHNQTARGLAFFSQIAFTMVASVFIGVFAGRFLDNLFDTTPWLLLTFSLLGVGAAIRNIFNISKD